MFGTLFKSNKSNSKKKIKKKIPRTVQQTIPYVQAFDDGVFEIKKGVYSKTIEFQDINYQTARQDEQEGIFIKYGQFLNYFSPAVGLQITINNKSINRSTLEDSVLLKYKNDFIDVYREEYNNMLVRKISEGRNDIRKERYVTISIEAADRNEAKASFMRLEAESQANLKKLGSKTTVLPTSRRLEILHDFYKNGSEGQFYFDFENLKKQGITTKDIIGPDSFEFKKNYFMMGDKFARALYVNSLPSYLTDAFLNEIADFSFNVIATTNIRSVAPDDAIKLVKRQLSNMESEKQEKQKAASKSGYDTNLIPSELKFNIEEAEELLSDLRSRNQKMFLVNVVIVHIADTLKDLQKDTEAIQSTARKHMCQVGILNHQQEDGLASALPLGNNRLYVTRTLTTESTAILMPFNTQELVQSNGMYYGLNAVSRKLIMPNRKNLKTPNGFILGTPGCFTGDTQIKLTDGSVITFDELVNKYTNEEFKVYSYDPESKKVVEAVARNPRVTKDVKEICKVELNSGEVLKCTTDHRFLTLDGHYVEAIQLTPGIKLMPMHTVKSVKVEKLDIEVPMFDIEVDDYSNFQLACGIIVHNSGKSFSAKREMINVLMNTDDDVIIIDPEREYTPLAQGFKGEIVHISASSKNHINPLDISKDYADDDDPITLKSEFVLSLCECLIGGKDGLTPAQKTIIDRCVTNIYRKYFISLSDSDIPTLLDFQNEIDKQPEPAANDLSLALELYTKGNLATFSKPTNINVDNRLIIFDTKDLGKQLKTIGLLIVLDAVWNRITKNRAIGKNTWIYIDEIYLLFKNEYSANFLFELYKRARKWGGVPTGITQNVKDLLGSETACSMLSNSDFILMLNQASSDRNELVKLLNISETLISYVTNSDEGQGLIFFGGSIIPFEDKFPKNTKLYKMMTTKVGEIVESEEKEEKAVFQI